MIDPRNTINIVGRLTADPETPTDKLIKFGLAVDFAGPDGVGFFDVTYWTNAEENARNVKFVKDQISKGNIAKGSQVQILGRLVQERWETDGSKRSKVAIVAESVAFAGSRPASAGDANASSAAGAVPEHF